MRKRAFFLMCVLLLTVNPFCAYSMDLSYIENDAAWPGNGLVTTVPTEFGTYYGIYQYYIDHSAKCVYFHISYNESSLTGSKNNIEVAVLISSENTELGFIFSENGFVDGTDDAKGMVDLRYSFKNASEYGQDIYFGIEFTNRNIKSSNNNISLSISVNENVYNICSGLELNFKEEKESSKTTVKSGRKEGESAQSNQSSASNSSAVNDKTTKYKYTGDVSDSAESQYENNHNDTLSQNTVSDNETAQIASANGIIREDNSVSYGLSSVSKVLIAASAVLVFSGAVFILKFLFHSKKTHD